MDDERGPRCVCGHYRSEHDGEEAKAGTFVYRSKGSCTGAYATLAADADDHESVEVLCACDSFMESSIAFEVR